jgi:hypothetical protein
MNAAMHDMSAPISGRQWAIVAVLRAGFIGPIGQHVKIGVLRGFMPYPRPYYTRRQLMHSRPVLGPLRPIIDTRQHCARRQPGAIGENALLMTSCPPIEKGIILLFRYCMHPVILLSYCIYPVILYKTTVILEKNGFYTHVRPPPYPKI